MMESAATATVGMAGVVVVVVVGVVVATRKRW